MAFAGRFFPRFNADIWRFLIFWGMVGFGYFGINAVLFNLYLIRLGYGPEFIGLLIGTGQIVWAVFALPAASIGLRIGLKHSMILGQLIVAAGGTLILFTEALPEELRAGAMIGIWMVMWVGVSINVVNSVPYLTSITSENNRSAAFSFHSAVVGLLGFVGSLIAGAMPGLLAGMLALGQNDPVVYRYALLLAPAGYLLGTSVLLRAQSVKIAAKSENRPGITTAAPVGILIFFGALIFLQSMGDGALRAFYNIYLDTSLGVETAQIGTLMGFSQLLPVATALLTPWFIRLWGLRSTLIFASILTSASLLLIAGIPSLAAAAAGLIGVMGMGAILNTTRTIFGQMIVAPRWRATISAISSVGLALAWGSAAGLGGYISGLIGFRGVFMLSAFFVLSSVGLLLARPQPATVSGEA
jgi:MFS family permease